MNHWDRVGEQCSLPSSPPPSARFCPLLYIDHLPPLLRLFTHSNAYTIDLSTRSTRDDINVQFPTQPAADIRRISSNIYGGNLTSVEGSVYNSWHIRKLSVLYHLRERSLTVWKQMTDLPPDLDLTPVSPQRKSKRSSKRSSRKVPKLAESYDPFDMLYSQISWRSSWSFIFVASATLPPLWWLWSKGWLFRGGFNLLVSYSSYLVVQVDERAWTYKIIKIETL